MKNWFVLLSIVVLMLLATPVTAKNNDLQYTEATEFFEELLQNTKNPLIASLAQENLKQLNKENQPVFHRQVEVPLLRPNNKGLALPVLINSNIMATFMVDTGATYTVITPMMARKLGVEITPETPRISIATANGVINAPVVTLKSIAIGGVEVRQIKVIVQNLGSDILLAGLLGMNFFQNMDLIIKKDKLILDISHAY